MDFLSISTPLVFVIGDASKPHEYIGYHTIIDQDTILSPMVRFRCTFSQVRDQFPNVYWNAMVSPRLECMQVIRSDPHQCLPVELIQLPRNVW